MTREKLKEFWLKQRARLRDPQSRKKIVLCAVCGVLGLCLGGALTIYGVLSAGLPDVTRLDRYDPAQTTKIYASDGTLIATLFDENRTPVTYEEIAPLMREAIVSIEDRRFFEHGGVDWKGIARAALGNFSNGGVEQGASTLTMQLARRLFLSDERTYTRKLREAILANRMDRALSKEKILELYLNEVYFGAGAYGIDAAAGAYFGVNPKDLNLWQSAMLAGLVQAPSAYSPLVDKKAALARTAEVLQAMEDRKIIPEGAREKALKQAADYHFVNHGVAGGDGMLKYPYFTTYVIAQLSEEFPENYIRRGGLHVYTTLDPKLQETAESALKSVISGEGLALGAQTGAVVVLDNDTGDIKAMVGGMEWDAKNQFNRAWQAKRQPGSSFKMFVYSTALENGYSPESEFADTDAVFNYDTPNAWHPANSDRKFMGPIPLRTGLQFSRNVVAAKVMAHVGPEKVVSLAHRMGIEQDLPEVISLALGAGAVTPLEMARAYSVLPNGGLRRPNLCIKEVQNAEGEVIKRFDKERSQTTRALSSPTATTMCEMLRRVVLGGTGTAANINGTWVAGKTGTTDSFVDAWFVGFTPYHTISVWVGRDDNKPMGRVYGGTLPAHIFRQVAEKGLMGHPSDAPLPGVHFQKPQQVKLCWDSTYLALPSCPRTYTDSFYSGVVPTRYCPIHRQTKEVKTVEKLPDGTLTNVQPVLTATPAEDSTPDDPRQDPEVVTPQGAVIPYKEQPPESRVKKVITIKVKDVYPRAEEGEAGQVIRLNDNLQRQESAPVDSPATTGEDAISGSSVNEGSQQTTSPGHIQAVPAQQAPADMGNAEDVKTEVIYTNQSVTIPADPVGD